MQHVDQHQEAIQKTVVVKNEVTVAIFDDKVREMGYIKVSNGHIEIHLEGLPIMNDHDACRDFVLDSIRLGLEACWKANSDTFERRVCN